MKTELPRWTTVSLLLAGIYNLLWGAWVVLFPSTAFTWLDVDPPKYLEFWQCIGMIVGCYGIAYLIAATDPARYWPITLVGLIGKVAGPIGFVQALWNGVFPLSFGWLIVFNDLIWWAPFSLILWLVYRAYIQTSPKLDPDKRRQVLSRYITSRQRAASKIGEMRPALLIFLRHSGCTFCREMLADLQAASADMEMDHLDVVVFHMSSASDMDRILESYHLSEIEHVSDPECEIYRAFGLSKGSLGQLFGLKVWKRGWQAAIGGRHGVGILDGDGFQMPGVFGVYRHEIKVSFVHKTAAVRPDFVSLSRELLQKVETA